MIDARLLLNRLTGKLFTLRIIQNEHVNVARGESHLQLLHHHFDHLRKDNVTKSLNDKKVGDMDGAMGQLHE